VSAAASAGGPIDLPAEIQRELRDLDARGDRVSYYELLGVAADADGGDIRRSYLERSKRLHPDAWYGRSLGAFGPMLSRCFQRLAAAYQVLSDEETRAAYDKDHVQELSGADRVALQRRELSRAEEERRQRERRERLLHNKGFARIGAARKLYEEAVAMAADGERMSAIAALKAARELDPNRKEIAARLVELEREQARARAGAALKSAQEREEKGLWQAAFTAYTSAFQQDPLSAAAAMGAARCALESGDAQAASVWAARAVEIQPGDLQYRYFLAQAFARLSFKAKARAELTTLLRQHPDHKEAKALLRAL
jgi:hypothetical protein